MIVYEYRIMLGGISFYGDEIEDFEEAIDRARTLAHRFHKYVQVITWSVERNLPGAIPDYVHRSCALRSVAPWGEVTQHNIHGG